MVRGAGGVGEEWRVAEERRSGCRRRAREREDAGGIPGGWEGGASRAGAMEVGGGVGVGGREAVRVSAAADRRKLGVGGWGDWRRRMCGGRRW